MIVAYQGISFWPSKIIRWMNWSDYSHVGWMTQQGTVVEAWPPKVRETKDINEGHTPKTKVHLFDIPRLDKTLRERVDALMRQEIGKEYDWPSVFRFLPRRPQSQASEVRWFCSELIFSKLQMAGIDLFKRIPAYKVSPGMLVTSPLLEFNGECVVGETTYV